MARVFRSHLAFIALAHDTVMAALAFTGALYLRVGGTAFPYYAERFLQEGLILFVGICVVVFAATGLYRGIWRYASLNDMIAIVRAVTIAILLFLPAMFFLTRLADFPRSQLVITWFVLIALLMGPRMVYRVLRDRRLDNLLARDRGKKVPVLLLGAGDEAEWFLRAALRQPGMPFSVVGIVAEKPSRVGRRLHGVEVMGTIDDLSAVVERLARRRSKPQRLLLTKEDLDPARLRRALEIAEKQGMTLARIPRPIDLKSGAEERVPLRPIAIEDLLGRPQAVLDRDAMRRLIEGRNVLVTGAGGSIGSELVRQISDLGPASLALLDNSEYALYEIDRELAGRHPALPRRALLADVRDRARIDGLIRSGPPDIVFHAAALKHVPMVEAHPAEGVLTNVAGTMHVADACRRHGVAAMVLISTDKAVNPTNVMGATKRLAETYCQALDLAAAQQSARARGGNGSGATRFVTVRFGNVLGSTGSVVPLFQKQLAAGGPLTVTHKEVTRYFMTIGEAVELVLMASALGTQGAREAGKIFVLDMGAPVTIDSLARQMIRLAGLVPDRDIRIEYTGLRPGEKLYEELLHEAEDLVETDQDGILLAAPRAADAGALAAELEQLAEAASAEDMKAVQEALRRLVPEFQPEAAGVPKGTAAPARSGATPKRPTTQ